MRDIEESEVLVGTRRSVRVVPYDASWPAVFETVREELGSIFTDGRVEIRHIGGTSVPGLSAKPVIDVLVEAPDLAVIDAATSELEALGYEARGEHGIPGRRYFSRPGGGSLPVHVHGFVVGSAVAEDHLCLRDHLRRSPTDAARYGELKVRLAGIHADERNAYQAAKAAFVVSLLEVARRSPAPQ